MARVVPGIGAERPEDIEPVSPPPTVPQAKKPTGTKPTISLEDYILLKDISCVDADGTVFEQYDHIYVRKDIERDADKIPKKFSLYAGAVYFEQQGLFLPSFALSCNVITALYQQRANSDIEKVLQQYKDNNSYDWQVQNTLINYATKEVVHYPTKDDFAQATTVNSAHPRRALPFSKTTFQNSLLENAIRDPASAHYVRQLTGLADPSVLVEIGQYFQRLTQLTFPLAAQIDATFTERRAAWLGCYPGYFELRSIEELSGNYTARGIRLEAP